MPHRRLSSLPGHWLIVRCCGRTSCWPMRLLIEVRGDMTIGQAVRLFRCSACGVWASSVEVADRGDGKGVVCEAVSV